MDKNIKEALVDCVNINLPKDLNDFDKVKCNIHNGKRIFWFYQEDLDFFKNEGLNPRGWKPHSGIVVATPYCGETPVGGELSDYIIISVDKYPCEKCYPEIYWIAFNKLVGDSDLIEIYGEENI